LLGLELAAKLRVLAIEEFVAAKQINSAVLRGGHQPGAGIIRNAGLRPPLKRDNQSILRELLGQAHIADDARKAGDKPGRLDLPDGVDDAMSLGH
jgi:hypothetical protein